MRSRVEGRALGSEDRGSVVTPNSWRRQKGVECDEIGVDYVEKTSPSCGGERAYANVDGGEYGESKEVDLLAGMGPEEEAFKELFLELVTNDRAVRVVEEDVEVIVVLRDLHCQGCRVRWQQGRAENILGGVYDGLVGIGEREAAENIVKACMCDVARHLHSLDTSCAIYGRNGLFCTAQYGVRPYCTLPLNDAFRPSTVR